MGEKVKKKNQSCSPSILETVVCPGRLFFFKEEGEGGCFQTRTSSPKRFILRVKRLATLSKMGDTLQKQSPHAISGWVGGETKVLYWTDYKVGQQ